MPPGVRRDRRRLGSWCVEPRSLVVAEEEHPVLHQGPPNVPPKMCCGAPASPRSSDCWPTCSRQFAVAVELERVAVDWFVPDLITLLMTAPATFPMSAA